MWFRRLIWAGSGNPGPHCAGHHRRSCGRIGVVQSSLWKSWSNLPKVSFDSRLTFWLLTTNFLGKCFHSPYMISGIGVSALHSLSSIFLALSMHSWLCQHHEYRNIFNCTRRVNRKTNWNSHSKPSSGLRATAVRLRSCVARWPTPAARLCQTLVTSSTRSGRGHPALGRRKLQLVAPAIGDYTRGRLRGGLRPR